MQYPIFQVPYLGEGMLIGLDAVTHVVMSHAFPIGVFTMLILMEYLAFVRGSEEWDQLRRSLLKVTVILITAIGAVLGVGIWFVTSALAPRAIGSMLRIFFWPWFIEWIFFFLEVLAILLYYYTDKTWTGPRKMRHIYLGVGYVVFALISAVLITGILGFMLTPDGWPWSKGFWGAFFNPSYAPQLALRVGIAYTLGTLFTLAYIAFRKGNPDFKRAAEQLFGRLFLASLAVAVLATVWYYAVVPSNAQAELILGILIIMPGLSQHVGLFWLVNAAALVLLGCVAWASTNGARRVTQVLVIPALVVMVWFVFEFERTREFVRGPYVLPGYMYANQVLLPEKAYFDQNGTLPNSYWFNANAAKADPAAQGLYLFGQNCSSCHTIGGINDIVRRAKGRPEDGLYLIIGNTHTMVPFMAPFAGTDAERRVLASYLYKLSSGQLNAGAPARFVTSGVPTGGEAQR